MSLQIKTYLQREKTRKEKNRNNPGLHLLLMVIAAAQTSNLPTEINIYKVTLAPVITGYLLQRKLFLKANIFNCALCNAIQYQTNHFYFWHSTLQAHFKCEVFFGCESSPISRNVRSSVSQLVSQSSNAKRGLGRPSKAQ